MARRDEESFASVHGKAVRENLRTEMNRALSKIYEARYVAEYRGAIYCYGTKRECEKFADGLGGVKVREITIEDQNALAKGKRQAYRNP
jgi:hypothetical protein